LHPCARRATTLAGTLTDGFWRDLSPVLLFRIFTEILTGKIWTLVSRSIFRTNTSLFFPFCRYLDSTRLVIVSAKLNPHGSDASKSFSIHHPNMSCSSMTGRMCLVQKTHGHRTRLSRPGSSDQHTHPPGTYARIAHFLIVHLLSVTCIATVLHIRNWHSTAPRAVTQNRYGKILWVQSRLTFLSI
jgi:hypothetical protein